MKRYGGVVAEVIDEIEKAKKSTLCQMILCKSVFSHVNEFFTFWFAWLP